MKNLALSRQNREQGFVLLTVYLVITIVSIFSIAYFARSVAFTQANERNLNKMVAFNMAESGLDWAIARLNSDPNYTGTPSYVSMDANFVRGGFTVTVTQDAANPRIRVIRATGYAPSNVAASRAYQTASTTAYCQYRTSNLFDFAVFAKDRITLTGTDKVANVDSYDSRNGAYGTGNSGSEGDVAVISVASGAITLKGKTMIDGDALIGPGGDPDTVVDIGNNATITGNVGVLTDERVYTTPTTTVPSSGPLDINGEVILMPGVYHYSSLKISGNGRLTLTGPTEIYVDNAVDIVGNGVVTQNNIPTNLILYVSGTSTVKIAGSGAFYGAIYAPNAPVQNDSNKGLYGSVVSKSYVQSGNSSIHFDVALKEIESDKKYGAIEVLAWQEQNLLMWGIGT
ncbi:MAG: hypothetical protein BWY42_00639 [Candidatus Omnitrophica bacterium ADurb.Bin277]|nr:MAG: hypothetical protein BWY42_00639 [Candidatus Omnitrophica bacterium ADurb.Bin277]